MQDDFNINADLNESPALPDTSAIQNPFKGQATNNTLIQSLNVVSTPATEQKTGFKDEIDKVVKDSSVR